MVVAVTITLSEELSKRLNGKVNVLDNKELRNYILALIEKDLMNKK